MTNFGHFSYAKGPGWQAVELPYSSNSFVMDILLPDEGQFAAFEDSLDWNKLSTALDSLESTQVDLTLPRFTFDSSFSLADALSALGMQAAFDPNRADFSGMADTRELFISSVVHKAFVSVNEEGTEAAAATAVMMAGAAMPTSPVTLDVNRPFLFLIRERTTGSILFLGRVLKP